jgi:hypothetical protein
MRSFFEWFNDGNASPEMTWLILGKGPSFAKSRQYDLSQFKTISLNHAVREQPVDLAHVIDADVLRDCGETIEKNARALVMPWFPHVNNVASDATLSDMFDRAPVLRRLSEQGRLLWYNLSTAPAVREQESSPVVIVKWNSAEAVLKLLAIAGARRVRSLGVDGGTAYSEEFADLTDKTLLKSGHPDFDGQFAEMAKIIAQTGIDYAPLDVESPVRVYVGTGPEQMLAVKVLEYSIRKHASMTVEVFPLNVAGAGIEIPRPKDLENAPRTPFSFQRFLIPQLAGQRGRAIYFDSDMQLFSDIRRLWTMPLDGADLLAARSRDESDRKPQFSVMLLDCGALGWDIRDIVARLDSGELNYARLMFEMAVAKNIRADISPDWNSLEYYEERKTSLLHYTDMTIQPWVSRENPLGYLWVRDLIGAIDSGFIPMDYVVDHVNRGWVRPSLIYQVEHRMEEARSLPPEAVALDESFVPPYKR